MHLHKKSTILTTAALCVALLLAGYYTFTTLDRDIPEELSDIAQTQRGETLPYTDMVGRPVDLDGYEGTPLIINAWASWSPFSREELQDFARLKSEYGDHIEIIAINRGESDTVARAFLERIGNPSGVVFLLDDSDTFYKSTDGFSMPETVFYDVYGNSVFHKRGSLTFEEMKERVEGLLEGE